MNYTRIYNRLIESRKKMNRMKGAGVMYEEHHILPKFSGGTDESFNLVLLTQREHWIAHLLLAKLAVGQNKYKASQALIMMGRVISEDKRKNSRGYAAARAVISEEVSKRHKGTLIVNDALTGIRIGRVRKDHPKVLSGEWVFFHTGMKRTDEWKQKVGKSVSGEKNGTFTGMTNEDIIQRCEEVYLKYGYWTMNLTRFYCDYVYSEKIPSSLGGKYRKPVTSDNIKKYLKAKYESDERQFGTYAKHHTNRIKEEIVSGDKN
jgi:hypothetical protein